MISTILTLLCAAINLYSLLCVVSILLSWFPGAKYTKFGRFLSSITDPYLTLFSKKGRLIFGNIDFSPIISIGILSLVSSTLSRLVATGRLYIGGIIASLIDMIWKIASSFLTIFILLMLVRWIVLLVRKDEGNYDSNWYGVDQVLQKPVYRISNTFVKKPLTYKKALMVSWISLIAISIIGSILFRILELICLKIPF